MHVKLPKDTVNYHDAEDGKQRCGNCEWFDSQENKCHLVEGKIYANDYCELWESDDASTGHT